MGIACTSDDQFKIRMPAELKQYFFQQAEKNGRSANSEMLYRLVESRRQDTKTQREGVGGAR